MKQGLKRTRGKHQWDNACAIIWKPKFQNKEKGSLTEWEQGMARKKINHKKILAKILKQTKKVKQEI